MCGNERPQTQSRDNSSVKLQSITIRTSSLQSGEEYILLHNKIFLAGQYYFEGCRIPLRSNLNIDYFRFMLYGYENEFICDFLEFGFPLGYIGKIQYQNPNSYLFVQNHSGAKQFASAVQKYLLKETSYGAILGPFSENPFLCNNVLSPLNTVPIKEANERRIVLDLSFPKGTAINDSES